MLRFVGPGGGRVLSCGCGFWTSWVVLMVQVGLVGVALRQVGAALGLGGSKMEVRTSPGPAASGEEQKLVLSSGF